MPTDGFTDAAHRHDFQLWFGINGDAHPVEDVSVGYGDVGIASVGGLTRAENRRGSSGVNITPTPSDNQEYVVATGSGHAGRPPTTAGPRGRGLRADGADDLEPDRGDDLGEREPPRRPVAPRRRAGRFAAGPPVGGM